MPLNVIYIDDEPDLLDIFAEELASEHVQVKTFSDPHAGIAEINRNPPDLLFLDYQLPGITGEKIAQSLSGSIPKFLITGNLSTKPQTLFVRVLPKPFDYQDLKDIVDTYLKNKISAA